MKLFWVDLRKWDKQSATAAIESGADGIVVSSCADAESVKKLGRISVILDESKCSSDTKSADLVMGRDIFEVKITDKKSENNAADLARNSYVIVSTTDWTVIPLENLVAQSDKIIAAVSDEKDAAMALGVLEKGTCGILVQNPNPDLISAVGKAVKGSCGSIGMMKFRVKSVEAVGMGERVCVDTCSLLKNGEGMLTGNTSSSFFLVHAETLDNPYVAARPFRVNAGAVHAYALMADGKTKYLSELKTGDHVLISDNAGCTRDAIVGRVKIETRPLLLIEAESVCDIANNAGDENAGDKGILPTNISVVLQNAETIRLVRDNGEAVSVVDLKCGDIVMGRLERGGRHFGHAVKESIIEK